MKTNGITGAVVMQRAWALLLAAALCLGLMPALAWADEGENGAVSSAKTEQATEGSATLTIVYGLAYDGSPQVLVNKNYAFYEGATWQNLLDTAVAAGDIKAYELNDYGFVKSITSAAGVKAEGPSDSSLYWSNYVDGGFYGGSETMEGIKLVDGSAYQLAWASYPSAVVPSNWDAVSNAATAGTGIAGGSTSTAKVGESTLSIVYGLGFDGAPDVRTNKVYSFAQDATLKDLLDAAVTEGSLKAYELNDYGYLASITFADGMLAKGASDSSTYWSNFVDGGYYSGTDTIATQKLESGKNYQFAWLSYPTAVAPSDWKALSGAATEGQGSAGTPSEPVVPETPTYEAKAFDETAYKTLFSAIADSYAGTSDEWKALGLAAIGRAASADISTLVANAQAAALKPDTTNLQRFIIPLTALGKTAEATALVDTMATSAVSTNFMNGQAFALLSYESGDYAVPADAMKTKQDLIANLIAAALPDGGWSWGGGEPEADMTAMVLTALAPYVSQDTEVKTVVDKGLEVLRGLQQEDGGFGAIGTNVETTTNANSTAAVVIALSALGIDSATSWATQSGATPLSALLSQASADLTSFVYGGKVNDMATQQGFLALASYQGFKNTKAAYNIYTQAQAGQAALPGITKLEEKKKKEEIIDNKVLPVANKKALAKTGDNTLPFTAGVTAAALCALAAGVAATRRLRSHHKPSLRR